MNPRRQDDLGSGGLVLEGLPGDNPLGFLAALGVLRISESTLARPGHHDGLDCPWWVEARHWGVEPGRAESGGRKPSGLTMRGSIRSSQHPDFREPKSFKNSTKLSRAHCAPEFTLVEDSIKTQGDQAFAR